MKKDKLLDIIISEVSYMTKRGYPNWKEDESLYALSKVLRKYGLTEIRDELIYNLINEGDYDPESDREEPPEGYVEIGGHPPLYVRETDMREDGTYDSDNVQKYRMEGGSLTPVDEDEEEADGESEPEDDGEGEETGDSEIFQTPDYQKMLDKEKEVLGMDEYKTYLTDTIYGMIAEEEGYTHKGGGYYVKAGDEDKDDAQIYKRDGEKFTPVDREEYEKAVADKPTDTEKPAEEPAEPVTPDMVDEPEEEPKQKPAYSPETPGGQAYLDSLPDDDPAKPDELKDKPDEKERELPDNKDQLISNDHTITDTQLNMTNKEAKEQSKKLDALGVGAGTAASRAGEAMVHKGIRLLKDGNSIEEITEEFTKLVNSEDHILNTKSGKEWVPSAVATLTKINDVIGIDNIDDVAWDTPDGRTAIGVSKELKTSADMFVRTKDGKNVGLSLKKDGQVFLNNGSWGKQSKIILKELSRQPEMTESDLKTLETAMSINTYKKDLLQRFRKTTETITADKIRESYDELVSEKDTEKVQNLFGGKSGPVYFKILEYPDKLLKGIENGKLTGDQQKAYSKLLQLYHSDEYNHLREADNALTERAFKAINQSESAKSAMRQHIIKVMHIPETVGVLDEIKDGGVDEFMTLYGIKPDGAVLNEETLNTLLGTEFKEKLNETIQEVRQGTATPEDLNNVIAKSIEIDYDTGYIMFKHENNKKYPLFYMTGRSRGIGTAPVMEVAQTPFMAHALKTGTFDTTKWHEDSLKRFEDDIKFI